MANNYGTNPMILDTAAYSTGTVSITQNTRALVGSGTNWDPNIPASPATLNRDRVVQLSFDSGTTWYTVGVTTDDTNIVLEELYTGETLAGAAYISRTLLLGSKKIKSAHWVGATAGHIATIRDVGDNIKLTMTANATNEDEDPVVTPFWCHGFALRALPSGTLYVYLE